MLFTTLQRWRGFGLESRAINDANLHRYRDVNTLILIVILIGFNAGYGRIGRLDLTRKKPDDIPASGI